MTSWQPLMTADAGRRPEATAGERIPGQFLLFHRNINWLLEVAGKYRPVTFSNRYSVSAETRWVAVDKLCISRWITAMECG